MSENLSPGPRPREAPVPSTAARANDKDPWPLSQGSCALSARSIEFPATKLAFPATKLDVPRDRARLRLATPTFCVNARASVVLAIHRPYAQLLVPVGEIYSDDVSCGS